MPNINAGRGEGIRGNYGGLSAVYIINFSDPNYDPTVDETSRIVSDLNGSGSTAVELYKFDLRGTSSFSQTMTGGGRATGTNVYTQTLSLSLKTVTAADNAQLRLLSQGRPRVVVRDYAGNLYLAGRQFGLEVTSIEAVNGAEPTDFVGYTLTLVGDEREFANALTAGADLEDSTDATTFGVNVNLPAA